MNKVQLDNQHWQRLDPFTRESLRRMYRCMRELSQMGRPVSKTYVHWAASIAAHAVRRSP